MVYTSKKHGDFCCLHVYMWQKAIGCIKNKTDVKVVHVYYIYIYWFYGIYTQLMLVYVVNYFDGRVSTFPERNAILLAWHVFYSSHSRRLRHCMFSQDFAIITHFYCINQSCSSFLFAFPSILFAHWVPWSKFFTNGELPDTLFTVTATTSLQFPFEAFALVSSAFVHLEFMCLWLNGGEPLIGWLHVKLRGSLRCFNFDDFFETQAQKMRPNRCCFFW